MKLQGKAWVYGGILDVDWEICPLRARNELAHQWRAGKITEADMGEKLGKLCLTNVDPEFPNKVQKGDFVVGGPGMGYGHDHDHACQSMIFAGVGAVLCDGTNTNFKRNSIHHGLPVVEVPGILEATKTGDEMEVDLAAGTVRNLTQGTEFSFPAYPDFLIEILRAGGLYKQIKAEIQAQASQR